MPSRAHESLIELFRRRPQLAAELLTGALDVHLPTWQHARLESAELTELAPTEWRADTVIVLTDTDGPTLGIIIEIQLNRDTGKRRSWPVYLTTLHARLRCPAILLVVCPDPRIAHWCTTPIDTGQPGWTLQPLVLGPDQIPVVTDPDIAKHTPELSVLSAIAHGSHPDRADVLPALLAGLSAIDNDEHATLYADVVLGALSEAARHHLEALMTTGTYEYQSDFARRYFGQGKAQGKAEGKAQGVAEGKAQGVAEGKAQGVAEGKAEGKAEGEIQALLAVLTARGIDLTDDARARITDCTDPAQLETWIRRAATAHTADEIFS